jgi:hypothetical protein
VTSPLTTQQLDEIETRAASLHEYATLTDEPLQADADQLTGEDVPALIAAVRRLTDRVAELEAYAHGCDGEGCVLPHSSWCEVAKKSAAENDGCTCPRPWEGHPQPHAGYCWLVSPPRNEIEEMRRALAARPAEEQPTAPDTLPAWLRQRFTASDVSWEHLDDGGRAYWEHQARAVRRAVARNGFKPSGEDAAASPAV